MPRKARIDAPGAVHHIIIRGIDRKEIFKDDFDRNDFLDRLGKILQETATTEGKGVKSFPLTNEGYFVKKKA